jgi:hypothetical protein
MPIGRTSRTLTPLVAPATLAHVSKAKTRAKSAADMGTLGIYHRLGIGGPSCGACGASSFPASRSACDDSSSSGAKLPRYGGALAGMCGSPASSLPCPPRTGSIAAGDVSSSPSRTR